MHNNRFVIPTSRIITFLVLISFFRPVILEKYTFTNALFNSILIVGFVLCFIDTLRLRIWPRNIFATITIIYYLVMLYSTVRGHGSISRALMYALIGYGSVIFAYYMIKYELIYACRLMRTLLWMYTIINIATVIIFPNGITQTGTSLSAVYFLGQPTRYAYFYFPALLFCAIEDELLYRKIGKNTILIFIICFTMLVTAWTVGSSIAMFVLVVFYFFHRLKIFNTVTYFAVQLIGYFGLVYFSIQKIFETLILGYLKKDMTMSSRTLIWKNALNAISESPYLGIGILDNVETRKVLGFVHAHNHLLHITFSCGYIGLTIFFALIVTAYAAAEKYREFFVAKICAIFVCAVGIQLLMDTVDGVRNHYIFMLAICAFIGEMVETFNLQES